MVTKTIVAFMNAEGGTLFIGVDNDGNVLGLQLPSSNQLYVNDCSWHSKRK
jgi:predicted HTH transcriptional regulator